MLSASLNKTFLSLSLVVSMPRGTQAVFDNKGLVTLTHLDVIKVQIVVYLLCFWWNKHIYFGLKAKNK